MQAIVFFDGVCNLCNASVQFLLNRDKKGKLKFASLQGENGKLLCAKLAQNAPLPDSIILSLNDTIYIKSEAALQIARILGGAYSILFFLAKPIPLFIRDKVYDFIAKNRYAWFGKKDQCMMPDPSFKSRFLD